MFHRWHHAAEAEGLNRNFAGMFPFIDLAFGVPHAARPQSARYGIPEDDVPGTMWGQLVPFRRKRPRAAAPPPLLDGRGGRNRHRHRLVHASQRRTRTATAGVDPAALRGARGVVAPR